MFACFGNAAVLLVFFVLALSQVDALEETQQLVDQDSDNQDADFWENAVPPPVEEKKKPICDRQVNVFNLVIGQFKDHFFLQGDPKVPDLSNMTTVIPRGCTNYATEENCCAGNYIRRIAEDAAARAKEMEFVRDQYLYFAADVVEPALKVVAPDSPANKVLSRLKNDSVHDQVINYIDSCEDKLRLHFAATACKLCDKGLRENLRENRFLALGSDSCRDLHQACGGAADTLRKAGAAYQVDRDELAQVWAKGQQDIPIARALTWLDRASRLLRVRADDLESSHYTPKNEEAFCNKVAKQGFVYRPYEWGNVLMLHVSTLATDYERSHFVPGEVQQYLSIPEQAFVDRTDRARKGVQNRANDLAADEEREAREGGKKLDEDTEVSDPAAVKDESHEPSAEHQAGLMELSLHEDGLDVNLVSPAEISAWDKLSEGDNEAGAHVMDHKKFVKMGFVASRSEQYKLLMKEHKKSEALHNRQRFHMQNESDCEHGEVKGFHWGNECVCDDCWAGVNCNEEMPTGPYLNQEFEPLEAQVSSGALQTLSVAGCELAVDLNHQLARIMLKPVKEGMEHIDSCAQPRGLNGESTIATMPLHVPMLATKRRYEYRIDVPIGQDKSYQVCYCFGPGCFESDDGWISLGVVNIFRNDDDVKRKVQEMKSPGYRKHMENAEFMYKACPFDAFVLGEDSSIKYQMADNSNTMHFSCEEGFDRLTGPQSLICVDGTWKVKSLSTDWTAEEKANQQASVMKLTDWNKQLPRCKWKKHDDCPDPTEHLGGATSFTKGSEEAHEDILTMNNTEDGLFWYMCKFAFERHERLLVAGDPSIFKAGDLVLVKDTQVGEYLGMTESGDHEVSLQFTEANPSEGNVTVKLNQLEKIERDGVFTRRCTGSAWSPATVYVRCASVQAEVNNFVAQVVHASKLNERQGDTSDVPEDKTAVNSLRADLEKEERKEHPVEIEYGDKGAESSATAGEAEGAESKDAGEEAEGAESAAAGEEAEGSGGSFLELGSSSNVSSGDTKGYRFELPKIDMLDPPLILEPWPVVFQKDASLKIQSCYTSHIDCVTGKVAADTVAALMRVPERVEVPVPDSTPQEESSSAWTYNLILAAVMAFGVLLAVLLLGWSGTQQRQPTAK